MMNIILVGIGFLVGIVFTGITIVGLHHWTKNQKPESYI